MVLAIKIDFILLDLVLNLIVALFSFLSNPICILFSLHLDCCWWSHGFCRLDPPFLCTNLLYSIHRWHLYNHHKRIFIQMDLRWNLTINHHCLDWPILCFIYYLYFFKIAVWAADDSWATTSGVLPACKWFLKFWVCVDFWFMCL